MLKHVLKRLLCLNMINCETLIWKKCHIKILNLKVLNLTFKNIKLMDTEGPVTYCWYFLGVADISLQDIKEMLGILKD